MAFFGIGGSDKKTKVSEGVVHDSKQETDAESQDILAEFEAQFSNVPEQGAGTLPDTQAPAQTRPAPTSPARPSQPTGRAYPSDQPPQSSAPPTARPAQPPVPSAGQSAPPLAQPFGQSPQPSRTPAQRPMPSEPSWDTRDASQQSGQRVEPSADAQGDDLPDFDFDFHPSPVDAAQSQSPRSPPSQPHPPQQSTSIPPFQSRPEPRLPTQPQSRPEERRFDLPDFTDTFDAHPRADTPSWLDEPSQPTPQTPEPAQPPRAAPPPAREEHDEPEVVMREGTMFIEKHALARHLTDLGSLRGLSHDTNEKFTRIDVFAREEKKLLAKMQSDINTLHDNLEHADELLFSGD